MKKALISLILVAANSFAAVPVAELTNIAGGKIILTEGLCRNRTEAWLAYATDPTNATSTMTGCWVYDGLFFHILWDRDNKITSYPAGSFKEIPKRGSGI